MIFYKNKTFKFILIGLLLPSLLLSTEFLSDRMKATLDAGGKLKIESNYLTNYILRGYNSKTKESKYLNIVSASDKKINFDLVDIEWNGLFPKDINFKLPKDNWEPTNNNLVTDYSSTEWKNMQLNLTGSGLLDIKIALQDPSVDGADLISTFLLNLVGLANASMEAVGDSSKLTSQFNKTKFDKLRKLSETITGWKSQVKSFGTYVSISRISLEYVDAILKELKIDKNVDHYLSNYYRVSSSLITSIKELEKLSGTIASVNSEEENKLKGNLAERFKEIDAFKGVDGTPSAIAKEIAKQYKSATNDSEKTKILMDGLMPLAELVDKYEDLLKDKLKVTGISETEKKELNKKILFLKGGRAIIIFASLIYGEDDLFELARKNPEKIMNSLIEIGKTAVGEILKLDNLDTITKVAYKKYVGTFGISKSADYYNNINKIGKANVYMKAVALGATIGNKLIPMVWDIVMSPYSMSSLVKDGKLNKFGLLKSKVGIYKRVNGTLKEIQTLTNTIGSKDTVISVNEGETIEVFVDGKQERLFENSVAPWIVSPSYTPRAVYDILISTPTTHINDYVCVRKIIGNTDFSVYSEKKVGSYNLISGQCGVGTLFGGDWYKDSINPDELNNKYKLYLFYHDITQDNLSNISYTYNQNDNKYITVSVTDINYQNTFYKIKLVPALKNVTFTSDTSALTSGKLIVSFNNANIEASTVDPITSYTYDWGDNQSSVLPVYLSDITHTYSTAGKYTVTLTVTTESGMTYTFSEEINVGIPDNTPPTANAGADQTITTGESVTLNGTGSDAEDATEDLTFEWTNEAGDIVGEEANITIPSNRILAEGNYTFTLTVTDSDGASGSDEVSVIVVKDTPQDTNLTKGLVAHYEFEGDANDSSGNGNHGVAYGGVSYEQGVIGQAGSFDSSNSYIEVLNSDSININNTISLFAWVNFSKGGQNNPRIISKDINGFGTGYELFTDPEGIDVQAETRHIGVNIAGDTIQGFGLMNVNTWHYIGSTYDANVIKLYIDGNLVGETEILNDNFQKNNGSLWIGNRRYNSYDNFVGKIDDLRIYNRALNESEIKRLYEMGKQEVSFVDNFDSMQVFENNWTQITPNGCCGAGNPASSSIENGKLILTTNGGSDGYMGIGDGSYFYPKNVELDGDFILEVNVKELLREKTNGYKDNSGFGIYLAKNSSLDSSIIDVGIGGNYSGYFEGYSYNEYNAHRISSYNPITKKHIFIDEYDLNTLYGIVFKIERKGNKFIISYKLDSNSTWIEHSLDIVTDTKLVPIIRIGSGDGGVTRQNGKFSCAVDYFKISKGDR